jgi:chaperonin GroES
MKIKPMDDRVLVQQVEAESQTASGIIIPDSAKEKPQIGKVIEVGNDEDLQELIKAGDKILFGKYGGEDFEINGEEYKLISRADILAIVED